MICKDDCEFQPLNCYILNSAIGNKYKVYRNFQPLKSRFKRI